MRKKYRPEIIVCKCKVCKEKKANFIVPYLLDEAYCWHCWKKQMESDTNLKLSTESKSAKFL